VLLLSSLSQPALSGMTMTAGSCSCSSSLSSFASGPLCNLLSCSCSTISGMAPQKILFLHSSHLLFLCRSHLLFLRILNSRLISVVVISLLSPPWDDSAGRLLFLFIIIFCFRTALYFVELALAARYQVRCRKKSSSFAAD